MNDIPKLKMLGMLDIKGIEQIRRVYDPGGISPTLTTCGGGQREVKIFDFSSYRVRKLTPTEYGRLQAFPMDDWEQVVSDSQAYKQFGNAVTTTVATAIAERLKACLRMPKAITADEMPEPLMLPQNPLHSFSTEELLQEVMRRTAV